MNKCSETTTSKQATNSTEDASNFTVFVGAHVPLRLYHHLVAETERAGLSRSEVIRRALADRYDRQQETRCTIQGA
jgi:hypothetical protein